jgi:hypothetical protein
MRRFLFFSCQQLTDRVALVNVTCAHLRMT